MRFWSPTLNKINNILADLYLTRDSSYRLVIQGGLEASDITFSDTAVDNWHNILLAARKTGRLTEFLTYVVETSQNPDLTAAYDEYLKAPTILGGGGPKVPVFVKNFGLWLKRKWRLVTVTIVALIVALTAYYYLVPVTLSGYVSCATPESRLGEHLAAATVRVPGTLYETTTDANGAFTIKASRSIGLETLEILYGMRPPITVSPDSFINNDLRVVACENGTENSPFSIPFEWWTETPRNQAAQPCEGGDQFSQVKLYTMQPGQPIRRTQSGELIVNVVTLGRWQFVNATVTRPLNTETVQAFAETTALRGSNKRQWGFDIPGGNLDIRIQVCFGSPASEDVFSKDSFDSNYYFQ